MPVDRVRRPWFALQVVQLQELFDVRHSVFIVGNAGTGKSMVWKSLYKANQLMKKKPITVDLNPKAVTNNELFGIINPATREWKDGQCVISTVDSDMLMSETIVQYTAFVMQLRISRTVRI